MTLGAIAQRHAFCLHMIRMGYVKNPVPVASGRSRQTREPDPGKLSKPRRHKRK